MDWRRGGWTGSLNCHAESEVRTHMRTNAAIRRARNPFSTRILRSIFVERSAQQWIFGYIVLNGLVTATEYVVARYKPASLPAWAAPSVASSIFNVSDSLISVQVGVLGLIALAIALITIIAQREDYTTDVHLYYHESLAFEVLASSLALLLVMCVQLLWPTQFLLHRFGEGTQSQFFKLVLLGVHTVWLTLNLAALSHFTTTTFRFVQQSQRELLRERYVVNSILPDQLRDKLRKNLYAAANIYLLQTETDRSPLWFGSFSLRTENIEVERSFRHPAALYDVRTLWIRWVGQRWLRRCQSAGIPIESDRRAADRSDPPRLLFPIELDYSNVGLVVICRRHGGIPLDWLERFVIRHALRFKRATDEG
jgi:hypothetical protein